MGAKPAGRLKRFSYDSILKFVRGHEDPCVTAGEIAEEFGVTNEAANYRLAKLKEKGKIQDKRAGASAKVWYIPG